MREIKFRGKFKSDDLWEFGSLWIDKGKYYINGTDNNWWEVIPETVGQYTGLKDKNGVEIYEGDIVKLKYKEWATTEQIIFKDGAFMLKGDIQMFQGISLEVIGNIHESRK